MELKEQLSALETNIKADNKVMIEKALESLAIDQKLADSSIEVKALVADLVKQAEEKLGTQFNDFSAALNAKKLLKGEDPKNFVTNMKSFIADNMKEIQSVTKGKSVSFDKHELKVVANMLVSGDSVSGDYIRDYNRTPIVLPGHDLNVSDLIPTVTIDGGTYTYVRETAGEGAVATQTEGNDKPLVDFNFSHIDVTTDFIAGRTVYSKKMRNNLQYLQSFLPEALRKRYFITENTQFNTALAAAATVSSNFIAGRNIAELITADVATLDIARYSANGIVMNKASWYTLLNVEKSTGAGYGLPFGFTYENGTLRCLGIPVLKADWIAATKYYVGDWSMIEKVVSEGLSLEFSDQERFSKNEIVARIEAQVAIAIKEPASLIIGDTDAVA